jgi:[ribosomal protein S5]-alanine N-acetyltransferase
MLKHLTFETQRLHLKLTSEEEASYILALLNTPKFIANIGDRKVRSLDDAKKYIYEKMQPQADRLGYGNYSVFRKSDGVFLGTSGLYDRVGLEGIDIGFAYLPEFEGQGYGFEAAYRLKLAAIHQFGLKEIKAITTTDNISSQKLIEKLGLKFIEITRIEGDSEDLMLYRLTI